MSTRRQVSIIDAVPVGWLDYLSEPLLGRVGRIGLGLDVATTEKATSNPSSLAVTEEVGLDYFVRLLLRWKTSDPRFCKCCILRRILKC